MKKVARMALTIANNWMNVPFQIRVLDECPFPTAIPKNMKIAIFYVENLKRKKMVYSYQKNLKVLLDQRTHLI